MKLSSLGEDGLIRTITAGLTQRDDVVVGPGDDCAVLEREGDRYQLLKTDCIVEGVHYLPEENPERVGWKAVARVVSDFAAMGGCPESMVITIVLRADTEQSWVERLYTGMQRCADRYQFSICGGETSSVPAGNAQVISVASTGWVEKENLTLRSGGSSGDLVLVTGKLGGSIRGKHLDFEPRQEVARWLVEHFQPTAMMDLSDGLGKDLPRLAAASGCGFHIDEDCLPCNEACSVDQALSDGEDYELLFCISEKLVNNLLKAWEDTFPDLSLTIVGQLIEGDSECEVDGWEHFVNKCE